MKNTAADITEQRRAEKVRQESDQRLRTLIENLPVSVFMKDLDGRFQYVSPSFADYVGREIGDILGKTTRDLVPAETANLFVGLDREVHETRRPLTRELEVDFGDGRLRILEITRFPLVDADGVLLGVAGLNLDVTERRRTEGARQESEGRLRALIENLPLNISMSELDGRHVVASPMLAANLGRDVKDVLGRTIAELVPCDAADKITAMEQEVRATRRPVTREITSEDRAKGSKKILEVTKFPVFNAAGTLVSLAGFGLDITDRRRAEEQLANAQKMEMVGQLAGGIAHDFNNLLAIICGHLEILQETEAAPGTAKRLQAAQRAVRRGTDLTERLLAIGRRQNLRVDKVRVDSLLDDMVEVVTSALGADIHVEVSYEPDLWPIHIDPGRLEDAMLNIAINARAAMPAGGRLEIRAANLRVAAGENSALAPGRYILLSLDDTGTGIPGHIRPRILEPFFTTKRHGTGLGLSVVDGFLRQSGGALVIDSEEGQGTRVCMYLPCRPAPAAPQPANEKRPANNRRLALVVDDEQEMLALTTHLLRQLGYDTRAATDANTALTLLARHPDIALLVTDVIFGDRLEGLALARSARERIAGLPVILMSGQATRVDLGDPDGSTVFLRKPFGGDELAYQLSRLLPSSTTTSAQKV